MGRDHRKTDEEDTRPAEYGGRTDLGSRNFQVDIVIDEPEEYRSNTALWPFRKLAAKQMREQGFQPLPNYTVLVHGPDAEYVINDLVAGIEVEVSNKNTGESRAVQADVSPTDWDCRPGFCRIYNPVDPDILASSPEGTRDRSWPPSDWDTCRIQVYLVGHDDNYVTY